MNSSVSQIAETHHFTYTEASRARLDKFLVECFPDQSRSRLQAWIDEGLVLVNGIPASKSGVKLEQNDKIQVSVPLIKESDIEPENIPLDIIFENDDLMIVNKPAGMVVHPAAGHHSATLVHAALAHAPEMAGVGGERRPGVVHRLDKGTSGLIILAKNDAAHHHLQSQFSTRLIKKYYIALVDGFPPTPTGRIDAPIARDENRRKQMMITSPGRGKNAVSEYTTLETFAQHTLMQVQIFTGRTHQIRLHTRFIGCPVAGDILYGHKKTTVPLDHPFLHAARLELRLPGESETRVFEAPLPTELVELLDTLRSR